MVDEDPWARPPEGEEWKPAEAGRTRPRWRLPVLLGVLVVVVLGAVWVVAAKRAVDDFAAELGDDVVAACDGSYGTDDVRPAINVPSDIAQELAPVGAAFDAYFAQDQLSYTDLSEDLEGDDPDSTLRFTVDGDVFERSVPGDFDGLIKPGAGIARFEGDRFWVPTCVNGPLVLAPFNGADCIEVAPEGDGERYEWTSLRDDTSCEDAVGTWSATLEDGKLTGWGLEVPGRFRTTARVQEPRSLSWPSRIWVVPGWLVPDGD